jgi:hypothetical protein
LIVILIFSQALARRNQIENWIKASNRAHARFSPPAAQLKLGTAGRFCFAGRAK